MNGASVDQRLIEVEVSQGSITFSGCLTDESRPVLLGICGIFPLPDQLGWMQAAVPEADVLVTHLPRMHFRQVIRGARTVREWHPAYREAVARKLKGRRVIPVGVSAGCLVALGLASDVEEMVLVEPFLEPSALPRLKAMLDRRLSRPDLPASDGWREYVADVLGIGEGAEPRSFSDLTAALPARLDVVVGSDDGSLYPPSFSSAQERELWASLGRLHIVEGVGHDVPREGRQALAEILRSVVRRAN